jgi:hypothetical protein
MRNYDGYSDYGDDHIRLYAPVLQRVIILTAVIVAVPVVMWTVTTFVRGYIGRPKVPVIAHVAAPQTPAQPPLSAQTPLDTSAAAGQPGDAAAAIPNNTPNNLSVATETALAAPPASSSPPPAIQPNAPAAGVAVDAGAAAVSTDANPISAPTVTSSVPPNGAAVSPPPSSAIPTRASDSTVVAAAPTGADRGLAWPNPNSTSPPNFGTAPAGFAAVTPAPAAMPAPPRSAAAEIMPAGEPIHGPVPLPRHRPGIFVMVGSSALSSAANPAASSAAASPVSGRVPMPRVRPSAAPAESLIFSAPSGYEPGLREY